MSGDNKRDGNQKVLVCMCLHQVGSNPWICFYKIYSITHLKCVSMATISGMSMKQGEREGKVDVFVHQKKESESR